jgi:zinc D-Ala-D-Ala dipeptidase
VPRETIGAIGDLRSSKAPKGEQELTLWRWRAATLRPDGEEYDPGTSPGRESNLVGRTLHAGIRVREKLGETPVGPLHRAEYPTGLEVAVLILGSASDDSTALAFLREPFRLAIQIHHPNVAAVHELGETHDGLVYAVVECLAGELLSETLARRGALPLQEALDLCLQAAAGLQAAHTVGWVHGKLSPDTLLLTQTDAGRPLVKLIGFSQESLVGQTGSEPPVASDLSAEYASPERIAGHPPDERSDVFSLGAVLHHLVTGRPPALASQADRVPEAMRAVLNRALAPSPARRFQTVAEFVAALALPQEADGVVPKRAKAPGTHVLVFGGVAAALVAVAAGLWLLWGTQRPTGGPLTRARFQESGSVAVVEPDSMAASARRSADSGPVASGQHNSAATRIPARSVLRLPVSRARRDSAPEPKISPFRQSHPWVAVTGERFYYPSSCPTALQSRDLLYFTSEEEARASGFVPNRVPGCYASDAAAESLLVDVRSVDSTIQVELRYATANNFTGAPLPGYEAPRALLHREVATALGRAQARLRRSGLGLRIFDAYRPVRASIAMVEWAERTGHRAMLESGYIAQRSRHNLGVAVDLTLVDLVTGTEVPMGSTFDSFTTAAHTANATGQALRYREILAQTMESEGFSTYDKAWWHFGYPLEGAVPLDRVIR